MCLQIILFFCALVVELSSDGDMRGFVEKDVPNTKS